MRDMEVSLTHDDLLALLTDVIVVRVFDDIDAIEVFVQLLQLLYRFR